ncbi:C-type lectin domain family 10 member A-like [Channa argus]|uniref:C-type lectin domain family 10 member A-like n=1 Tax=Channa argus TaxID=215402 RepID=UPI003520FC81
MNKELKRITLKNPNVSLYDENIEEEAEYVNAAVNTVDKKEATPDVKFPSKSQLVPPLTVCWVTLVIIMSLRIYFALKQMCDVSELKQLIDKQLSLENEKLNRNYSNLQVQYENLKQQIKDMETKWKDDNVTRAQWSIDQYCPKDNNGRTCKACQSGWLNSTSICYAPNNAERSYQKTWEEAREDCRGKNSDLAVIVNEAQKKFTTDNSWSSSEITGYWIGLKVEDGRWKWVDGTNLTNDSWIEPPVNGRCATSLQSQGWKSVNCTDKNAWICRKKALFV